MNQFQQVPQTTQAHYKQVRQIQTAMASRLQSMWNAVDPEHIAASWGRQYAASLGAIKNLQRSAAVSGISYVASSLAELDDYVSPEHFVNPDGFTGYAPDGRSLRGLLDTGVVKARTVLGQGGDVTLAKQAGFMALQTIAVTMVSDIARQAASVDIAARPGVGYTRMLNPPSCPDCVILAGKFFRWNTGFQRHNHCDCCHVPATEKAMRGGEAEGLVLDPYEYFGSLDEAMQNRVFGKANAQAIRDGSDIFQVVNSRRGRQPGKMFTTEGMTKRGNASKGLKSGQKRLTPDGIYHLAEKNNLSRAETLGLLQEHGYVLPGGQNPLGVLRGQREGFGQHGRGGARKAASSAVLDARASGIRDLQNPSTMTAAERRVWEAERNWLEVQSGYNPYTAAAIERRRGVRIVSSDAPLTDAIRLRAENAYREAIITRGAAVSTISKEERLRRLEEWKTNQREILAGRRTILAAGRPTLQTNTGKAGNGAYYNAGQAPVAATGGAGNKPPKLPRSASTAGEPPMSWGPEDNIPHLSPLPKPLPGEEDKPYRYRMMQTLKSDMSAIPRDDPLYLHEIEFVRKFEAAGHRVRWIPRDSGTFMPTNDFEWLTGHGMICELKCTTDKYPTIKRNIQRATTRAGTRGVVKDSFVIDIGPYKLSDKLRNQLGDYNIKVVEGHIVRLFVMSSSGSRFEEITLKK